MVNTVLKEQERLLSEIEELANETIPKKTKITITYVNGEKESFNLNYDTRAKTIMDL